MILDKLNDTFDYQGKSYMVGDIIYANKSSVYEGLTGIITEIRDGDDKETENQDPDIYCSFQYPQLPQDIDKFEKQFSSAYRASKKMDDIPLDQVIMSPDMIDTFGERCKTEIYILHQYYLMSDGCDEYIRVYKDYRLAKHWFNQKLAENQNDGCIKKWSWKKSFQSQFGTDSYECWIDEQGNKKRYKIEIHSRLLE